ncbi:MAG: KpsF/GutQ family sugar-phosphate isomerase [Gammaproteobacteria bacterium]|nr:KpsF/GutQ family sugar-phosphate isomerase [Gammaproteobacteria bacterium]MDH5728564.1 KpsF/GutQ family sugar-phosphate isomerase [Gammaproteobacteria bacterium]
MNSGSEQKPKRALADMGRAVIEIETQAVQALVERIDDTFVQACEFMLACEGRVVVLGMGKSGHVGGKIAATLASTGTPAFFVHPAEASHGDLGMITAKDVVLAISNSGETHELLTILPIIKREGVPLIAMTGRTESTLAQAADAHIDVSVAQEACPLGLAPTASTTATLVMGDALAVALLEQRGFTKEDFARSHPGGALGRRLLLFIEDVMQVGDAIPIVTESASLADAIIEISKKRLGFTAVVNANAQVVGVFTDGDLRRHLDHTVNMQQTGITEVMTRQFSSIQPQALAAEALHIMQAKKIHAMPVINEQQQLVGALNIHDLLREGVA